MRVPVATQSASSRETAWFGESRHPAEGVGKPCVATVGTPAPIRGLHAARVHASEATS